MTNHSLYSAHSVSATSALLALLGASLASTGVSHGAVAMHESLFNYALNQPTFGDTAFGAPTSRGVDGVIGGGNWTHADYPTSATPYPGEGSNAPNPYWQVTLGASVTFDNIVINDRLDSCCDPHRLNGATISVLDSGGALIGSPMTVAGFPVNNNGSVLPSLTFDNGGAGWSGASAIRVDGVNRYFQFSELAANGTTTVPINWALGATANFFDAGGASFATWPDQPASFITDGDLGTISHGNTPLPHAGYFFEVDLGQEIQVDNIDLFGRNLAATYDRLEDYQVEFLDANGVQTYLYTHSGQTTEAGTNIDVIGAVGGNGAATQFVRIINANGADYGAQIAEIEVYGVIPEPSGGLLAALGGLLLFQRRRQA